MKIYQSEEQRKDIQEWLKNLDLLLTLNRNQFLFGFCIFQFKTDNNLVLTFCASHFQVIVGYNLMAVTAKNLISLNL